MSDADPTISALQRRTDPLADELVASAAEAQRLGAIYAFVADRGPAGPALRDWLERAEPQAPLDQARIRRGQAVYARYSAAAMLGLLCKGLPESYASPRGAAQLLIAGRFAREPRARLMETARFLAAVMEPRSFDGPEPMALREASKVRLVHAIARRSIAAHPDFDPSGGAPINQAFLTGTLLAFSSLVLDALPMLGVHLSEQEEADYYYVWQAVGPALGVEAVPASLTEGRRFFEAVRRDLHGPSPAGQVLTEALLTMLAELIPGDRLDDLPAALLCHLCGPDVARYVGVARPTESTGLLRAVRLLGGAFDSAQDAAPLFARVAEPLGRALYEVIWRYGSGGERPTYRPPGP